MKTVRIGGHELKVYDGIEDMPVRRFHRFSKCLMMDAGIGSDLTAVDAHISRAAAWFRSGDGEKAAKELENLRLSVHLVQEGTNLRGMAFACLVAEVDGHKTDSLDDGALADLIDRLPDLTQRELSEIIGESKKKIDAELRLYFPGEFGDSSSKEWCELVIRRMQAQMLEMETGLEGKVEEMDTRMLTFTQPRSFSGSNGEEVAFDRKFEDMCLLISEELHADPKAMTVMEYYNAYEYLLRRSKEVSAARR